MSMHTPRKTKNLPSGVFRFVMAGPAGFEPANDGTKTRCLTTWRRPNALLIISLLTGFFKVVCVFIILMVK